MASVQFYQTNGAAPGSDTAQGTGNGSNDWDFKKLDTAGPAIVGEEITAGSFSQHIYIKAKFGGSFSSITEVKYYASEINISGAGVGAYILGSGIPTAQYAQPAITSKSGTWDPVPTVNASGIDVSNAGLAAGTPGFTNYIGLQMKTTTSGSVLGYTPYTTWTLTWNEI